MPIIMLTAKGTLEDKIDGLDSGADDYLVKPFEAEELLARVRALLRRRQPQAAVLKFGSLTLDPAARQAWAGDRLVELSSKEFDLLELLIRHPKQVLTRETFYDRIWGYDFSGESNILEVYIRYLRSKLEPQARLATSRRYAASVMPSATKYREALQKSRPHRNS